MKKIIIVIYIIILICPLIMALETVYINPSAKEAVTINVLDAQDDYTVVEILLNRYNKGTVMIDDEEYIKLHVLSAGTKQQKGNPQLPIIARSVMTQPQAKMNVEIIDSSYSEIYGKVIPSKGSYEIPEDEEVEIPYSFSDVYQTDGFFPENIVELNDPYILREIRGIAFRVSPFTVNSVKNKIRVYDRIVIRVYADGTDFINTLSAAPTKITTDFLSVYQNHFINFSSINNRNVIETEQGWMLIICVNDENNLNTIQQYIKWKNSKGIRTELFTIDVYAPPTATSLKNYIQNSFDADTTLAFVQLVGTEDYIPPFVWENTALNAQGIEETTIHSSDIEYALLTREGTNDEYPDIFIGRFHASPSYPFRLRTQVERTIHYERDLNGGEWLSKVMGIINNHSIMSEYYDQDIIEMNQIKNNLETDLSYSDIDQFYNDTATVANISAAINEGRSIINYRRDGSVIMWGTFQNVSLLESNVVNLQNNWMLPHVVSIAPQVGNLYTSEWGCFAERWLIYIRDNQQQGDPIGGIAVFAQSNRLVNNGEVEVQNHINYLLTTDDKHTTGGLYYNGLYHWLDTYLGQTDDIVSRTFNIFGDASLIVRSKPPDPISVNLSVPLNNWTTQYTVTVSTPGSPTPGVPDALVSLYSSDLNVILDSGYTDNSGNITLNLAQPLNFPSNISLTVTAYNKITYYYEVVVVNTYVEINDPSLLYNKHFYVQAGGYLAITCPIDSPNGLIHVDGTNGIATATIYNSNLSTNNIGKIVIKNGGSMTLNNQSSLNINEGSLSILGGGSSFSVNSNCLLIVDESDIIIDD